MLFAPFLSVFLLLAKLLIGASLQRRKGNEEGEVEPHCDRDISWFWEE